MHFKVDEDLPIRAAEMLRDKGYDASRVIEQDMGGWKDPEIWQAVQSHGQFLVTVERVMGFATEEQVEYFLKYAPAVEQAIINSGTILVKYWLEETMEDQTARFEERINDYRKIWKLSPMDLESHRRWYDYSRARDAMFAATDTPETPWYVVDSHDQRRGRLNCISHLLSLVPYQEVPREKVTLPKRQPKGDYAEPTHPFRWIPEKF